ncbi:protein of unknown function [Methylocaldum szegediense]|uniref:Transposase n=1 Tax=Methylocaldum szegediense TaxID=73780 RepID=A0ABN8XC76_9GAMM|nr:protein of unknown function [Methylocaldum szegediense]
MVHDRCWRTSRRDFPRSRPATLELAQEKQLELVLRAYSVRSKDPLAQQRLLRGSEHTVHLGCKRQAVVSDGILVEAAPIPSKPRHPGSERSTEPLNLQAVTRLRRRLGMIDVRQRSPFPVTLCHDGTD